MARNPLGPPPFIKQESAFDRWTRLLWQRVVDTGQILWSQLDFTGSNLTDIATRNHADLQNINTASYTHLTATNHTDLTDGGDSTLHYHAADRARANHTGTQTLSTISDAWSAWGALINAGTSKTTPADADALALMDSAASNATKKLSWTNVKATLTTYFDTLYQALSTYLTNAVAAAAAGFGIITDDKLGALAFSDYTLAPLATGSGLAGTGTICKAHSTVEDGLKVAHILIDLTGLNSGGTAGDIIGVNGTSSACYLIRIPTMTVLGGRMTCLETPAGGDTDIDLYAATEGTGVEDGAISALTETQIVNGGTWSLGTVGVFAADPATNNYLYLVGQGTANATYTAGRFLIEIFGA